MADGPDGPDELTRATFRQWVSVGLSWSLTAACLDATVSLLSAPSDSAAVWNLFAAIVADTVILGALFAAIALICSILPGRVEQPRIPLAVALATAGTCALILGSPHSRFFGYFECQATALICRPYVGKSLVPALGVAAVLWLTGRLVARAGADTRIRAMVHQGVVGVPFIAVASVLAVWAVVYHFPPDTRGRLVTILIAAAITLAIAWYSAQRATEAVGTLPALFLIVALPFAGSFPALVGSPKSSHTQKSRALRAPSGAPATVVLITIDALRADALSCYGNHLVHTPNIDAVAEDGLLFESATSPAPWTVPAITSMMTGLDPLVLHTGLDGALPPTVSTLAGRLSDAGLYTAAVVTNGLLSEGLGLARDFDEYNVIHIRDESSQNDVLGIRLLNGALTPSKPRPVADSVTAAAVRLLSDHSEEPVFLWLHYLDTHQPYDPPRRYLPADARAPSVAPGSAEFPSAPVEKPEQVAWLKSLYLGEVRYVDDNIGTLVSTLKRLKRYDAATIVITADHGEGFWEHDRGGHGTLLYEEMLRVPLLVKSAAAGKGRVARSVSTASVSATLLDLSYAAFDASSMQAESLVGDHAGGQDRPVFSTQYRTFVEKISVRLSGLKYILTLGTNGEELFDLMKDPGERMNVASVRPDEVAAARALVAERRTAAQLLREKLHIRDTRRTDQEDTLNRLKALGYVQ